MIEDEAEDGFFRKLLPSRPKDAVCLGLAVAACGFIAINALFLQSGPHPAPIFTEVKQQPAIQAAEGVPLPPAKKQASARLPAATLPSAPVPPAPIPPAPVKTTGALPPAPVKTMAAPPLPPAPIKTAAAPRADARPDPIAELLEPANRTVGVQRALTEYGYGQIKPNGTLGPDTKAAIEKFERERKMPVTGQVSDRLLRELSTMTGRPL